MTMSQENLTDVEISCRGIDLMVNNDWDGCEKLFTKYKDHSPLTNYCYSYFSFMKAILTFEDHLLEAAHKNIENTQKLCTESTKMFSSFKKAFKISNHSNKAPDMPKEKILEDKFTKAIILADCKLYLAILTFVRQIASSYLTSGLLQIRKSWKLYAKLQKQLYGLYKKLEPNAEQIYGSDPNSSVLQLWMDESDEMESDSKSKSSDDKSDDQLSEAINELNVTDEEASTGIPLETVKRLLGSVSFGYGLFQICLSFMPPNILKLIKVFGFEGDRSVAIKAINFTSNSKDMRAPFADMVLLWYSTQATPLFGLGEGDVLISDEDTKSILDKNLSKYQKSSLFHYLKGKYCRSLLKDLSAALSCYEQAAEYSNHIREIELISIYEIGWIHMTNLEYEKALEKFVVLHKDSKWSRSFSTYICGILSGSMGNFSQASQYVKEALKLIAAQTKKLNAMECFNECLARGEHEKLIIGKYALVCSNLEIGLISMNKNDLASAKSYINKAQTGYKEFELEERIQTLIKSSQRRLKFRMDNEKMSSILKEEKEAEEQEKIKKQNEIKNFYIS
ncbi:tetratricopeptide repeat 39C-like [Brachionus plicatilis]|uniref:Tetratricopeptide repeat 39C-like n=1 Tax=Brachionus plicatilis TaxID=10195 RepID=A0A3M7SBF7_BRAPC|nr:tetratricopeptide repeat 39C-like [Brachionus plicatilis]